MECCVGVSTETVLQIVKFYTVVKIILKLTFWTVVLRRIECTRDRRFIQLKRYIKKCLFSHVKQDNAMR